MSRMYILQQRRKLINHISNLIASRWEFVTLYLKFIILSLQSSELDSELEILDLKLCVQMIHHLIDVYSYTCSSCVSVPLSLCSADHLNIDIRHEANSNWQIQICRCASSRLLSLCQPANFEKVSQDVIANLGLRLHLTSHLKLNVPLVSVCHVKRLVLHMRMGSKCATSACSFFDLSCMLLPGHIKQFQALHVLHWWGEVGCASLGCRLADMICLLHIVASSQQG